MPVKISRVTALAVQGALLLLLAGAAAQEVTMAVSAGAYPAATFALG